MGTVISRRKALWVIGGVASASLVGYRFLWSPLRDLLGITESGLTPHQWDTLGLLVNQIFPKSETSPSGVEAGVLNYMRRALRGELPGWQPSVTSVAAGSCKAILGGYRQLIPHYVKAVTRLDARSQESYGRAFDELPLGERAQVVANFAEGAKADVGYNVKGSPGAAQATDKSLFELLRRHSIEGYFADPANGGNKNYAAWESIKHTCHMNYPKDKGCG